MRLIGRLGSVFPRIYQLKSNIGICRKSALRVIIIAMSFRFNSDGFTMGSGKGKSQRTQLVITIVIIFSKFLGGQAPRKTNQVVNGNVTLILKMDNS